MKYYPDRSYYVKNLLQCKSIKFNTIFENRRLRKFRRDQLNIENVKDYQSIILQRYPIISIESLLIAYKEGKSPTRILRSMRILSYLETHR